MIQHFGLVEIVVFGEKERRNHRMQAYISSIQHKSMTSIGLIINLT